jgi:hypothetical protein
MADHRRILSLKSTESNSTRALILRLSKAAGPMTLNPYQVYALYDACDRHGNKSMFAISNTALTQGDVTFLTLLNAQVLMLRCCDLSRVNQIKSIESDGVIIMEDCVGMKFSQIETNADKQIEVGFTNTYLRDEFMYTFSDVLDIIHKSHGIIMDGRYECRASVHPDSSDDDDPYDESRDDYMLVSSSEFYRLTANEVYAARTGLYNCLLEMILHYL